MTIQEYDSLVSELSSFILKHNELEIVQKNADFDLKWRLTQLYNNVKEEDEQKFIDISGMTGRLTTTKQKKEIEKRGLKFKDKFDQNKDSHNLSDLTEVNKKTSDKRWAKSLYRRSVRRCHPDTLKVSDSDYKDELIVIYKNITESYENDNLDILMVESYKLFVKPKEVIRDQLEILELSKSSYQKRINNILSSQAYAWSTFNDKIKEEYLINIMKQKGVRFVDRSKVKEVLKRKISSRKMGQRPKNKLRDRVKNKK